LDKSLVEGFRESDFVEMFLPDALSARFDLIERIGFNDFGETFIVSEKNTKDLFVLKSQRTTKSSSGNEAFILKGIKHDGVPSYEEPIKINGTQYTLRRYIEGEPLNEYLSQKPDINISQTVDALISLCDILIYLHSQPEPIIHRDIKPSNIIYDAEKNSIMLIDFGISRKFQENSEKDTTYFGTHKYAPPEQYGFAQTDCRSDIYSFGVVMRYWLAGSMDSSVKIQDKRLEQIASKCTALDPQSRYRNAAALKKALSKYRQKTVRTLITSVVAAVSALILGLGIYAFTATSGETPVIYQTPAGFNEMEYQRLIDFFLYEENLVKIRAQHSGFDIENPTTWHWERGEFLTDSDGAKHSLTNFIEWQSEYVVHIYLYGLGLTGELDVSGFSYLEVLDIAENNITGVNLSECYALKLLQVYGNNISSLDLSGLTALEIINNGNIPLTGLGR